jgi:hypothetical protein
MATGSARWSTHTRMTIRMYLVVVALVALVVAALTLIDRSVRWQRFAAATAGVHKAEADSWRFGAEWHRKSARAYAGRARGSEPGRLLIEYWLALADAKLRLAQYHERLSEKYSLYARKPWLSVEPDPPKPMLPPKPRWLETGLIEDLPVGKVDRGEP